MSDCGGRSLNLKLNSTGVRDEVSSFTRSCFFALTWKAGGGGEICSVWSCNLKNILKLFFKRSGPTSIFYFPPDGGSVIEMFKIGGRDEEVTR